MQQNLFQSVVFKIVFDIAVCYIEVELSSGASAISEGDIFIYSCSAQLISFEIESTSKEIIGAVHEYMNMSPSLIALATLLVELLVKLQLGIKIVSIVHCFELSAA